MKSYFERVVDLLHDHPDSGRYFVDVSNCRLDELSATEMSSLTNQHEIVAGFRVPERSVSTTWVADRFVDALIAERGIEQALDTRVLGVKPTTNLAKNDQWFVETPDGPRGPFEFVINSLWEGRLAVDVTAGMEPHGKWSHRFRFSQYVRTADSVDIPSSVIATGPFGDIKNYNGRDFYLSWYPKGLIAEGSAITPPELPSLDTAATNEITKSIFDNLELLLPRVSQVRKHAEQMTLAGGWVFAVGQGSLADPKATLHSRRDFGIRRNGTYYSVDTGKYSTAPWLARELANRICPD